MPRNHFTLTLQRRMIQCGSCLHVCVILSHANAEIDKRDVQHTDGDVGPQGFVAWDPERIGESTPGILVLHQWMGLTDFEKSRCKQLAELGYVAFAAIVASENATFTERL